MELHSFHPSFFRVCVTIQNAIKIKKGERKNKRNRVQRYQIPLQGLLRWDFTEAHQRYLWGSCRKCPVCLGSACMQYELIIMGILLQYGVLWHILGEMCC